MNTLSKLRTSAGIRFLTPAVSPGTHCPMRIASVITGDVTGLSTLLIGMPECTIHSRLFSPHVEGENGELHWLYVLDEQEVVFGCREGVKEALRQMEIAGAEDIMLIATCIPELIGEDMEGIVNEVKSELRATVSYILLGQFKNISYPPGAWKTMAAMSRFMAVSDCKAVERDGVDESAASAEGEKEKHRRVANVLGRSPKEDEVPKPALLVHLESQGIELRYLAKGASIKAFKDAGNSKMNLVISPYMEPLASELENLYGTPYEVLHNYYHTDEIEQAYNRITSQLGVASMKSGSKLVAKQLQALISKELAGKSFVLGPRVDVALALTFYFKTLGMKPILLHLEEYYPEDVFYKEKLLTAGEDPQICRMVNDDVDIEVIKSLNPDICFGNFSRFPGSLTVVGDLYDFYGQIGYERTAGLLRHVANKLKLKGSEVSYGITSV